MNERRYRDAEVRRILELATRSDTGRPRTDAAAAADGLTLAEIQSIALEVGVEPGAVERAASSLETRGDSAPRTSFGVPVEVARTVPLPRTPTDDEWERIVAELRRTFRARGKVTVQGNLREWSNGNLHACVEPAAEGYRLRLGTIKGDAAVFNRIGAGSLAAGVLVFGASAISGAPPEIAGPLVLGAAGSGVLVGNLLRLLPWARERARQMKHIAAYAAGLVGSGSPAE